MFLTAAALAKSKAKYVLVRMKSTAETGFCFNVRRLRLQEKLVLLRYDPLELIVQELYDRSEKPPEKQYALIKADRAKQRVLFVEKRKIRSI